MPTRRVLPARSVGGGASCALATVDGSFYGDSGLARDWVGMFGGRGATPCATIVVVTIFVVVIVAAAWRVIPKRPVFSGTLPSLRFAGCVVDGQNFVGAV